MLAKIVAFVFLRGLRATFVCSRAASTQNRKKLRRRARAQHSSIISLHEIYETETAIYLVLDLVRGGELFDQIVEMSSYSEASAAKVVRQLTSAIEHLHLKSVVHRDLKPENLLLSEKSDTADVMLADFGLAALVDDGKPLRAAVGTPGCACCALLRPLACSRARARA